MRLYLVDGSLYVCRAWQSSPLQVDTAQHPRNATRGFAAWLHALLEQTDQAPVVCYFDAHDGRSQRRELHPTYKANRSPLADELLQQIGDCRSLCRLLGLPVHTASDGLEADDLIASACRLAQTADVPVTVVSGDKDLAQLLASAQDRWWDAGRRDALDARGVTKRFRVRPAQIPDWLALAGDAADNIAGVPGIGAATAARLLNKWGNLDTLFAHLPKVATMRFRGAPRVAELLRQHEDRVYRMRQLTGPWPVTSRPELASLQRISPPSTDTSLIELGIEPSSARQLVALCETRASCQEPA